MKDSNNVVVLVYYQNGQVLVEERDPSSELAGAILYPGGKIDTIDEINQPELALLRESSEELGVRPTLYEPLISVSGFTGDTGKLLFPYVVKSWEGEISSTVMDKGNRLFWESIDTLSHSPFPAVRTITKALIEHLKPI